MNPEQYNSNRQSAVTIAGSPVGALLGGLFFLASTLFTRNGLHDDVNPIFVLLWIAIGVVATRLSLAVWRPRLWPGLRAALRRTGPILTAGGWILGAVIIFAPPHDPHALDQRLQGRCRGNLEHLAWVISMYADDNGGNYPNRPEALLTSVGSEAFVCPSTRDLPATGTTPAEVADNFASGGHLSYIYVGKGLTTATTQPNIVLMYEPISNHHRDRPGIHVLYAGERVAYFEGDSASQFMQEMWRRDNTPTTRPVGPAITGRP